MRSGNTLPSADRSALPRQWFARDAPTVAVELLNKLVRSTVGDVAVVGRIVEVEAYTEDDPASHTHRGPTSRNRVMFGPPGHLYVYLSYGIHHCLNVVAGPAGTGQAVLVRAIEPVEGIDAVRARRGGVADRSLADGPGKVGRALGVDLAQYGVDLTDPTSVVTVLDDGLAPPAAPRTGPRIGVSRGVATPWRFRVP